MMFADSKKRFLLISFALYMFMYMTLLTAINQEASGIVDAGAQLILYYVDMFSVMMGFIIYSLFYDVFKKRDFPLFIAVFNVIILFCTFIVKTEAIFMIMAPIIGLLLGFFGGYLHGSVFVREKRCRHDYGHGYEYCGIFSMVVTDLYRNKDDVHLYYRHPGHDYLYHKQGTL